MDTIWEEVRQLNKRAEPHVIITVVRRVRPSSATVGDKAVVTADGKMKGFIGGHCTQSLIVEQAQECLQKGESKLLLVTPQPPENEEEGVKVLSMTCASGGMVELFLEPKNINQSLLLIGDSPVTHFLEEIAPRFSLLPRRILLEEGEGHFTDDPVKRLRNQLAELDNTASYGVVATMGLYDAEGLLALHHLPLRYVGLVTSPKR